MGEEGEEGEESWREERFERLRQFLVGDKVRRFREDGYTVLDGCFGNARATRILGELKSLQAGGLMLQNKTQFSLPNGEVLVTRKPHIFEADLHDRSLPINELPEMKALFDRDDLVHVLNESMPELCLRPGKGAKTIKLQYNAGAGACFPLHFDNPGRPNKRKVTCLIYLNPGWSPSDGGELQLMPFMRPAVTIPPLMDRLVLFESERILHGVLPANKDRFCFTIWLDADERAVNRDQHSVLRIKPGQTAAEIAEVLGSSPAQRIVSRAVYQEEYAQSLERCMGRQAEHAQMAALHEAHLRKVQGNEPLRALVQRLREHKQGGLDRQC